MLPILLALAATAHAEDGPYMWGVGPELGTIVIPFQHPVEFPNVAEDDTEANETDEDVDPEKENATDDLGDSLEKTGGDALIGVKGALYVNGRGRVLGQLGLGFGGGGYQSAEATFEYDLIPVSGNGVDAFVGAGVGFGSMRWQTLCDDAPEGVTGECVVDHPGKLSMSTVLLRGAAGVLYRTKAQGYELGAFVHVPVAGNRTFVAEGSSAKEDVSSLGAYPYVGITGTVYFGDMKPPGQGGKKGKKGKKNQEG